MARSEAISWAILKLVGNKGSTVLWAQANIQLQSPVQDVSLLEKIQHGSKSREGKSNSEADS